MKNHFLISLLSAMLLAACAGGPPRIHPVVPDEVKAKGNSAVRSAMLDETNHMTVHIDEKKEIVYNQSFGNSVAVGALFGPLGVLANIAATNAVTESDKSKINNKITLAPSSAFAEAAKTSGLQLKQDKATEGANFSPYLLLTKLEDEKVLFSSALLVEAPTPGAIIPQVVYRYQLPTVLNIEEIESITPQKLEALDQQLKTGYVELIKFYQTDSKTKFDSEKLFKLRSNFMNPRFDFEMPVQVISDADDRIWIRTMTGIASILKTNATLTGPWEE